MNLSVTHAWRKGNFKSVFRINSTKILINFIILYYQTLRITKQETQSQTRPCQGGSAPPPRKLKKGPPPKHLNLHIFAIGLNSHLTFTYLRRTTFPKPELHNSTIIYS